MCTLRRVLDSLANVFILNIPGKLLHQWQIMFKETALPLKFVAAKRDFNYIITLQLYLNVLGSMRKYRGSLKIAHTLIKQTMKEMHKCGAMRN